MVKIKYTNTGVTLLSIVNNYSSKKSSLIFDDTRNGILNIVVTTIRNHSCNESAKTKISFMFNNNEIDYTIDVNKEEVIAEISNYYLLLILGQTNLQLARKLQEKYDYTINLPLFHSELYAYVLECVVFKLKKDGVIK